jgi:CheY-like chemotaxis protein
VASIAERASERASKARHGPEVFAAAEGAELRLRAGAAEVARAHPPRPPAVLPRGAQRLATVLLVEDDPDMQELLRATLAHEQVRILAAGDAESALRLARAEEPSLMLLDLNLPGRDGLEVCRALRADASERLRDLPILVLTGTRLDEENVLEAFVAGATDFLVKPIKPTLLRSRVRGWLLRL